jgi:hypothetical protein
MTRRKAVALLLSVNVMILAPESRARDARLTRARGNSTS